YHSCHDLGADHPMKLSVIIPAYNEAATIKELLRRVEETPFEKEIIVVDDGSTDGTRELLAALDSPEIRVILHEGNLGKGSAVRVQGISHRRGPAAVPRIKPLRNRAGDHR